MTLASLAAQHAAYRDELLARISAALSVDDRFVAAWLRGSIGRGEDDAFSDLDLDVIVADQFAAELCARPWQVAGYTSDTRLALFTQFGTPAIIHESQHNAPTGGSFTVVVYDNALTVDWTLIPQSMARRSAQSRLLFAKAEFPVQPPSIAANLDQRITSASEKVSFFWMMATVTVKYMLRGDGVSFHSLLDGLYRVAAEVGWLVAAQPGHYHRGAYAALCLTQQEQIAAVRDVCDRMSTLMAEVARMGGHAPSAPMPVIESLLSLADDSPDRS
jgi:hypothetical protein